MNYRDLLAVSGGLGTALCLSAQTLSFNAGDAAAFGGLALAGAPSRRKLKLQTPSTP